MKTILMLGGNSQRFTKVLELIKPNRKTNIILSVSPVEVKRIVKQIQQSSLDFSNCQFFVDLQAIDTIDNFIKTKSTIESLNVGKVLVVTSDYHMRRAIAVGRIILSNTKLISQPYIDGKKKETFRQLAIDVLASRFYQVFGKRINDRTLVKRREKRKKVLSQFNKNLILQIPNVQLIE